MYIYCVYLLCIYKHTHVQYYILKIFTFIQLYIHMLVFYIYIYTCMCLYLFQHNKSTQYTPIYYLNKNIYFGCDLKIMINCLKHKQ